MKKNGFGAAGIVAALWLALTLFAWFGPRQEVSLSERRKLEQMPKFSWSSLENGTFMSKFEAFTQDQFPLREGFRRLKAQFTYGFLRQKDNHGIYLVGDQAAKLEYPLKESSLSGARAKFEKIYNKYLTGNCEKIVLSVVPDKGYYLAQQAGAPAMDYDRLFAVMGEIPWAAYADLTGALSAGDYYGTDTHWRQERLLPAATVLTEALGVSPPGEFRAEEAMKDFTGVYHGQAALPMDGERLYLMESDLLEKCTVYNYETGKTTAVYDRDKLWGRDPYDVFLSGSVGLLEIRNPAGQPGRGLVVFRDSFGSSMIPLLIGDYETVTVVDIRYMPTDYLGEYVDFSGRDVLFLYSTTVLNNSAMLK